MDAETKQKVTDTVMSILDEADMNVMTEFKVRKQASDILSIDLSQPEPKQFVRRLIQSYLDARAAADSVPQPHNNDAEAEAVDADEEANTLSVHESEQVVEEEEEQVEEDEEKKGGSKEYDDDGDLIVCRVSHSIPSLLLRLFSFWNPSFVTLAICLQLNWKIYQKKSEF